MVVELGRTMITGEDIMNLDIDDVIMLKHDVREPLIIQVEGVPKFKVYAGSSRGQKAVRIMTDIPPKVWEE
jgi:flagellar motor switch protein FliM